MTGSSEIHFEVMKNRERSNDSNFPGFLKTLSREKVKIWSTNLLEFLAKSEECCASAWPNVSVNIATSTQDFKELNC